ncbi:MAG: hypothetical protein KA797_01065 [Chitinophagales bacterium]|nr:hypothetical protein [Chitinophagales bacterium]
MNIKTNKYIFIPTPLSLMAAAIIFLLSTCQYFEPKSIDTTYKVYLDNPSNESMDIYINGQKNKVKKHRTEILELEPGEYHFKALNKKNEKIFETNIEVDTVLLVNLTKAEYWIVGELYAETDAHWDKVKIDTLNIENHIIIGNIKQLDKNQLFYKKEWDFNLDEDFIDTMDLHKKYYVGKKVFRKQDYIKYYFNQ